MKQANLTVMFDAAKLDALTFHLGKSGMNAETELQNQLQKLYEKHVPANVRAYVDHMGGNEDKPEPPPRRTQKEKPAAPVHENIYQSKEG